MSVFGIKDIKDLLNSDSHFVECLKSSPAKHHIVHEFLFLGVIFAFEVAVHYTADWDIYWDLL